MLTILSLLFAAKMTAASSIRAIVRGTNEPLEVYLLERTEQNSWRQLVHRSLPTSQRRIDFHDLGAGVYLIRVQRVGGGEQAAAKIIVGVGETRRVEIAPDPVEVFGRVSLGDIPLSHAVVVLKHSTMQWEGAIDADENGVFHARLWQGGAFTYQVRSDALATPYGDRIAIDGRLPFRWELRLPDRRIVGTVRDDVSGAAVAGATLHITTKSDDGTRYVNTRAGSDGRFDLAAMHAGVVTITAGGDGYLDGSSAPVTLDESDRERRVAVTLQPAAVLPMTFGDSAGQPLAGAWVLTAVDGIVRARVATGSDGRAMARRRSTRFRQTVRSPSSTLRKRSKRRGGSRCRSRHRRCASSRARPMARRCRRSPC